MVTETKLVDTACNWTRPISFTLEQAKQVPKDVMTQIIEHNEMGAKKCGWKPPGKAAPAKPASE